MPATHLPDLLDQIVERLVARLGIELRGFDDEQRRRVVMKEEVVVCLVQFPQVVVVGLQRDGFRVGRRLCTRRSSTSVGACR